MVADVPTKCYAVWQDKDDGGIDYHVLVYLRNYHTPSQIGTLLYNTVTLLQEKIGAHVQYQMSTVAEITITPDKLDAVLVLLHLQGFSREVINKRQIIVP